LDDLHVDPIAPVVWIESIVQLERLFFMELRCFLCPHYFIFLQSQNSRLILMLKQIFITFNFVNHDGLRFFKPIPSVHPE